jgi:hypothetical protein
MPERVAPSAGVLATRLTSDGGNSSNSRLLARRPGTRVLRAEASCWSARVTAEQDPGTSELVREQIAHRDLERVGDSTDVVERDVAFPSLDAAEVAAVQSGEFGELLLAQPRLTAQLSDVAPETDASPPTGSGTVREE